MEKRFFEPLTALREGDESPVQKIAESYSAQTESFFAEKYIDIMKTLASWDPERPAEKGLLYGMAVISGFFTKYHYVRGSAYSFFLEKHPEMDKYCSPWKTFLPEQVPEPENERLSENYSSGIYMNPEQVKTLLEDYEKNTEVRRKLEDFFGSNLEVFLTALRQAKESESGIMEASEVIEVNPLDLNSSTCYSDIMLCDPKGALIYQEVAMAQVKSATGLDESEIAENVKYQKTNVDIQENVASGSDDEQSGRKKGFLSRLFGRK